MQELVNLGIDTSKASMCWIGCTDGNDVYPYNSTFKDIFESHKETIPSILTPILTIYDILEILTSISKEYANYPHLFKSSDDIHWYCSYGTTCEIKGKTSLEAAFNILKWCKQNNYI